MELSKCVDCVILTLVLICSAIFMNAENITNAHSDDDSNKYLNSLSNNSNSSPELIEYYDVDEVSSAPESIYPDPDFIFNQNQPIESNRPYDTLDIPKTIHRNGYGKNGATKFNKLQELNNPMNDDDNDNYGIDEFKRIISTVDLMTTITTTTTIKSNTGANNDIDKSFKGKSIDFNIRHTMEELRNEDLRDHDIIDNIMYIYYGSNVALRKSLGGSIIIVGTVFALAAQILAIIFTLLRNRQIRRVNYLATISLNLLLTLCSSNLVFIVGVQTSKNVFKCEMIAVLLHYFHLSTAVWGLCHSFSIYDYVVNENIPVIKYNNLLAFGASAVFVLFSFAISSNSYEIYDYCWMSVQKSMIFNFMIPTSILIISNTIFGTMTLRAVVSKQRQVIVESIENILDKCQNIDATVNSVNLLAPDSNINTDYIPTNKCCDEMEKMTCDNGLKTVDFYDSKFDLGALSIADLSLQSSSDTQDFAEFKRAIKFSLFFQPAFSVCWFLGVVALENRQSCIMPVIFIVCYNILNWYILYRFPNISPMIIPQQKTNETNLKSSKKLSQFDSNFSISDEVNQTPGCTDTIPLLCSVTGNNSTVPQNSVAINQTTGVSTATLQSSNVCLSKQLSLEDIIYKTSISQWDASMENINLDCISTISN
ncbi:uncharacterized protein LOC116340077 [Contarinia nasturtii]|uniref:uncharacterized protein LOC116340077 n=1 Tax=Contarinia nasturtii TaxID=265458 RepID=UPI0012D3740E|nr:uncharacterized protein LOC116340077 [Contarinia nasturtii]